MRSSSHHLLQQLVATPGRIAEVPQCRQVVACCIAPFGTERAGRNLHPPQRAPHLWDSSRRPRKSEHQAHLGATGYRSYFAVGVVADMAHDLRGRRSAAAQQRSSCAVDELPRHACKAGGGLPRPILTDPQRSSGGDGDAPAGANPSRASEC